MLFLNATTESKLGILRALVPFVLATPCTLVPHMPYALHALMPHMYRVLHAAVPHVRRALRALINYYDMQPVNGMLL